MHQSQYHELIDKSELNNIHLKQCHLYLLLINLTMHQLQYHELIDKSELNKYTLEAVPPIFNYTKLDYAPISVP